MAKVCQMLYFDATPNQWTVRRPQEAGPHSTRLTAVTVAILNFGPGPGQGPVAQRVRRLGAMLQETKPTVMVWQEMSKEAASAVLALPWVRSAYATADFDPASDPHGNLLLWRFALPVHFAETLTLAAGEKRPCTILNMRSFCGGPCAVVAANIDPAAPAPQRARQASQALTKSSGAADMAVLFAANFYAGRGGGDDVAMADVRSEHACLELLPATGLRPASSMWVAGNRFQVGASIVEEGPCRSYLLVTLKQNPSAVINSEGTSPGSLPSSPPPSAFPPSPAAAQQVKPKDDGKGSGKADAAAAVAAAAQPPAPQSSRKRQWSVAHSASIRTRDGTDEVHYDLTMHFAKAEDTVRALNHGQFAWHCNFAISHGRLLAAHGTNADISTFRSYMQGNTPPPRPSSLPMLNSDKQKKKTELTTFSPYALTAPTQPANRRRMWSVVRSVLLYQVLPREMRLDITPVVGVPHSSLRQAVDRLNGLPWTRKPIVGDDPTAPASDPLGQYKHDYAVLYCPERQGYWLLACLDVPCDIAAARNYAKGLVAPVAKTLVAAAAATPAAATTTTAAVPAAAGGAGLAAGATTIASLFASGRVSA